MNATFNAFFPKDIAYEAACEGHMTCTTDMLSYKGYVARWIKQAAQVAPFLVAQTESVLRTSAAAAVQQCTGGPTGRACGFQWSSGSFDGSVGAGQTMNVLGAVSSLLSAPAPVTNSTGGTSAGDYSAGQNSDTFMYSPKPLTAGDRAGAAILTILVVVCGAGTFVWMSTGA